MKAGVEAHLSSYVPRHSWASMAYRHNVSLPVISQALGHGDTHITLIYIRGIDDQQVAKANKKTVVGNPLFHLLIRGGIKDIVEAFGKARRHDVRQITGWRFKSGLPTLC